MSNVNRIRTAAAFGIAALAFASAQPAFADEPRTSKMTVKQVNSAAKDGQIGSRRVCVVDTVTGSHIPRKVCDTLDGWKARGINPLADTSKGF